MPITSTIALIAKNLAKAKNFPEIGLDIIPHAVLKTGRVFLHQQLCRLFQLYLDPSTTTSQWKIAHVVIIAQQSSTSCECKLIESCLKEVIANFGKIAP